MIAHSTRWVGSRAAMTHAAQTESALSSPVTTPHLLSGDLPRPSVERSDHVLVIPSYNRPEGLVTKTMKLLHDQHVAFDRVFVFVAKETVPGNIHDEPTRYVRALAPLGLCEGLVVEGVRGLMAQRNFITKWVLERFGALMHVVSLDDDLESLHYKVPKS